MFPVMMPAHWTAQMLASETCAQGLAFVVAGIPWDILDACTVRLRTNHGQSIEQLAQRGGLDATEAIAVLEDRPWTNMEWKEANKRLAARIVHFAIDVGFENLLKAMIRDGERPQDIEAVRDGFLKRYVGPS